MSLELGDVPDRFRPAVKATLDAAGVTAGHLAVEVVAADRIRDLNREHRGKDSPTDVLSFPVDAGTAEGGFPAGAVPGPVELGDVMLCPEFCVEETEAVVHGVLHLCGYDHEIDSGEMLDLQERIVRGLGIEPVMTAEAELD
ncbi:MAG: rRNA maturation RNase YbeY [Solirubrobacterales bacterium]|nr:rRNA maturation RNase YbeY [Solirubrobacterales bacterium]